VGFIDQEAAFEAGFEAGKKAMKKSVIDAMCEIAADDRITEEGHTAIVECLDRVVFLEESDGSD
jgi:hypothetical protein